MNLQQFKDELRKNPEFVIAELQLKLDEANKKIAELEAERRWIPVSERLPEKSGRYLTVDDSKRSIQNYYCKWDETWVSATPTHWMPMPEFKEEQS